VTATIVSKDKGILKIKMHLPNINNKIATFDFDLSADTATGVALEMVKELKLEVEYAKGIKEEIEALINSAEKRQAEQNQIVKQ